MSELLSIVQDFFSTLGFLFVGMLCLVGLLLSCLSISGTWLVVGATGVSALLTGPGRFPGLGTLLFFIYLAVLVEVVEYVAGFWGVKSRGGSGWAGFAAVAGGMIGLLIGSAIPVPVFGGLLGVVLGSFGLVYAVEYFRQRKSLAAAHIAFGAVIARFLVLPMKVAVTLGMIAWLAAGIAGGNGALFLP